MATLPIPSIRNELDVPADRLAPVIGGCHEPALLESGPGFGSAGRFSILTARPRLVFEAIGREWAVRDERGRVESGSDGVLESLARLLDRFGLANPRETPDPGLPPFQGGMIGFFGYDVAPLLERLPRRAARDSRLPDIRFALYDTAVTVDHASGRVELWAHDLLEEGVVAVERRAREWIDALSKPPSRRLRASKLGPLEADMTREAYLARVHRALEYIAAGDIFQANLSHRFIAHGKAEPLDLYLRLKAESPAPFACLIRWRDLAVVSASPESFYRTIGDRIVTRPIKGTRRRGAHPDEDARLLAELQSSHKDRAELTMIVDLERNDLGRICRYGSVRVAQALEVESFAQVHHLVATIEGRIGEKVGPIDVFRVMFPGGSITGAPKIRAMEIIDELEPNRRSLYTGAIGYFSRHGASAFNIAIRTLIIEGNRVSFQVGGGIVADSEPEAEYHETTHKARGLSSVIANSGG